MDGPHSRRLWRAGVHDEADTSLKCIVVMEALSPSQLKATLATLPQAACARFPTQRRPRSRDRFTFAPPNLLRRQGTTSPRFTVERFS